MGTMKVGNLNSYNFHVMTCFTLLVLFPTTQNHKNLSQPTGHMKTSGQQDDQTWSEGCSIPGTRKTFPFLEESKLLSPSFHQQLDSLCFQNEQQENSIVLH